MKIVPPNANYGHSLGLLNFGIQENIEARSACSYEMNRCVPLFFNSKP